MTYLQVLVVLLRKNFLLTSRNYGALSIQFLAVFFSLLVLYITQLNYSHKISFTNDLLDTPHPNVRPLPNVPRCIPDVFPDCYSIAYVPASDPKVVDYVTQVAQAASIPRNETIGFNSTDLLNAFLVNNPNRTQAAYIFDPSDIQQLQAGNISFVVQYNITQQTTFPLGTTNYNDVALAPALVHAMNRVLALALSGSSLDVTLRTTPFPHPTLPNAQDAFAVYGPLLLYGVYFIVFVFHLYMLVEEKQRGLRASMNLAGLTQSQHFLSWAVPFFISYLLITFQIIIWGFIFNFKFFRNTDFIVYFLTFFIFGIVLMSYTFLFDVFVRHGDQVASIAFNFFIITYLFASTASIVYLNDADGVPLISKNILFLRQLFAILAPVVFAKSVQDIAEAADIGVHLTFSLAGTYTNVFPVRQCWSWMIVSALIIFIIALYLDNVVPSVNGTPLPAWFPFSPKYWRFLNRGKSRPRQHRNTTVAQGEPNQEHQASEQRSRVAPANSTTVDPVMDTYDEAREDPDVARERDAIASGARDNCPLVVKNIVKRFPRGNVVAVDDLSISVPQNTLLALLGRNGSGKTTLMKMLSTGLKPTSGDAFIYGLSVRNEQEAIRGLLGVCPQFDIYWDRLTGREHLEIFSALKGKRGQARSEEVSSLLKDVGLVDAAKRYVGGYSGGMQRRLSVALALTGDPAMLLLDEATTGTDPISRRDLWRIIERAKRNRVVLMITHSMEESEQLGDMIGIMTDGKLKVLGTSLHLKNKFGAGYKITVSTTSREAATHIGDVIAQRCVGTRTIEILESEGSHSSRVGTQSHGTGDNDRTARNDAHSVIAEYELPRRLSEDALTQLVLMLEQKQSELNIGRFSLNQTTLEDVFKRITSLSHEVEPDPPRRGGLFIVRLFRWIRGRRSRNQA